MKSKLFSSLVVLALISNSMMSFARADGQGPAPLQVNEVSSEESQSIANTQASQMKDMSDSQIQSNLNASADAIDAYSANPANQLSSDQQSHFKTISMNLRKEASDPKLKKKVLSGLSRAGKNALLSVALAGSTVTQMGLMPIALLGGLFEGLSSGKIDKDFISERVFEKEPVAGILILADCILYGADLGPGLIALIGGLGIDVLSEDTCANPQSDAYSEKLCKDFNAYDHAIDNGALVVASAMGSEINQNAATVEKGTVKGAMFIYKGSKKIAAKLFKKAPKTTTAAS